MRERLPNRRSAQRFSFHFDGHEYSAGVGYYPDGELGEVFLSCGKVGSPIQVLMLEASVLVSLALQHGCKVNDLYAAMPKRDNGEPESPIGTLLKLLAKAEAQDIKEELSK